MRILSILLITLLLQACNSSSNKESTSAEPKNTDTVEHAHIVSPAIEKVQGPSLDEQLWKFVATCKDAIINPSYAENNYDEIVDDAKNGYLHIEGDFPTCGCACSSTVGGYKKADGSYTLLKYEEWSCSTDYGVYSNENLSEILPEGFGLAMFFAAKGALTDTLQIGQFYVEVEIPRYGTETILNLKLMPLGLNNPCQGGICLRTVTDDQGFVYPREIIDLSKELDSNDDLLKIMKGNYESLTPSISELLNSFFNQEYKDYTEQDFNKELRSMYTRYQVYQKLKYTTLIMDWNREEGRFYIKDKKENKKELESFLQFLKAGNYYAPGC